MENLSRYAVSLLLSEADELQRRKQYHEAASAAGRAAAAARAIKDPELEFSALLVQAQALLVLDSPLDALLRYTEAITIFEDPHAHPDVPPDEAVKCYLGCALAASECAAPTRDILKILDTGLAYVESVGETGYSQWFMHIRSKLLLRLRDYREALAVAEEALAVKRLNPHSYGCALSCYIGAYADALAGAGKDEEALIFVTRVIETSRDTESAWAARANIYSQMGRYEEAIADYTRDIQIDPNEGVYQARAHAKAHVGDKQGAIDDLNEALAIAPHYTYAALWLAGISGRFDHLHRFANESKWIAQVARYYLKLITEEELFARAEEQSDRVGSLCEAHGFAGLLAEQEGDVASAVGHYQRCVEAGEPNFFEHKWAAARLRRLTE